MATHMPANHPLALADEKGQPRWLFMIHANRRLKAVKNPGKAAADDMYATSYPVQGMDGGWDAEGNPFLFVLSENGMIYHIHHQPPHWQHRAVTRLPMSRNCTNFQAALLGKAHVLMIQHAAQGEWGGTVNHYRVMGRDILPVDTSPLPRNTRHLYVQTGRHVACLSMDKKGNMAYSLLQEDKRQWSASAPLPYSLPGPDMMPAAIGTTDGIHLFWCDPHEAPKGYYAAIPYSGETPAAPQVFSIEGMGKEIELGWIYRAEGPLPLWRAGNGLRGKNPRRPKGTFSCQGADGKIVPVRVVRTDARHHRITHKAFAAVSGFSIIAPGISKEGKIMQNGADEDRLQLIEQRQKRLVAQLKDLYITLTQMQDEMMRQSRVLFQLESVTGTRSRTIKEYSVNPEEGAIEEPRPQGEQKGLQVKNIRKD